MVGGVESGQSRRSLRHPLRRHPHPGAARLHRTRHPRGLLRAGAGRRPIVAADVGSTHRRHDGQGPGALRSGHRRQGRRLRRPPVRTRVPGVSARIPLDSGVPVPGPHGEGAAGAGRRLPGLSHLRRRRCQRRARRRGGGRVSVGERRPDRSGPPGRRQTTVSPGGVTAHALRSRPRPLARR